MRDIGHCRQLRILRGQRDSTSKIGRHSDTCTRFTPLVTGEVNMNCGDEGEVENLLVIFHLCGKGSTTGPIYNRDITSQ